MILGGPSAWSGPKVKQRVEHRSVRESGAGGGISGLTNDMFMRTLFACL